MSRNKETFRIAVIRTAKQHAAALARIDELIHAQPGTPEYEELDLVTTLVGVYEDEHYPIEPLDPIDAIVVMMRERGLRQVDLVPYFGSESRVSEVLKRKRPLTLASIRNLHRGLGIPLEILIREPRVA